MKTTILLVLSTLIAISYTHAQVVSVQQQSYGSPGSANFSDMKATPDGGLIMCGNANGQGYDKTEPNHDVNPSGTDYWVVKTDKQGAVQWNRTLGSANKDECTSIIRTADGGYLVSGIAVTGASGTKTDTGYGGYDIWLVKLDSNGTVLWDKALGAGGSEFSASVALTKDGGFIVGASSVVGTGGVKTSFGVGDYDFWIVKLDAAGNIQWDKAYGGTDDDFLAQVKVTQDGGYILGGNSFSNISGDKSENSRGGQDYWVLKVDSLGNKQWDKTLGTTNVYDNLVSVIQLQDGSYIAAGTCESTTLSGDKTDPTNGKADIWLIKLNKSGKKVWDQSVGGNSTEYYGVAEPTTDGGFILDATSISGISGDKTEPTRGSTDYWIVKFKSNGTIQGDKTLGGSDSETPLAICQLGRNKFAVGGYSWSSVSGDRTVPLKGYSDFWIPTVTITSGGAISSDGSFIAESVKAPVQPASGVAVYPNPATRVLHITTKSTTVFVLLNGAGATITTKTVSGTGDINVARLPAGNYYLKNMTTGKLTQVVIAH